jgi:intein/homing endonuclease
LVNRAVELGLPGIGISEHESLGNSIDIEILQEQVRQEHPDFKIVHCNEIYLTDTREMGQKYYHFILIALDEVGFHMMSELSSTAWLNGYFDRGLMRVPTLKSDVEDVIKRYGQGHIYASQACLGSEISTYVLKMHECQENGDKEGRKHWHDEIVKFVKWCTDTFGRDNFCFEIQPSRSHDQLIVNNIMPSIAKAFKLPMCITCDAHYLTKEDAPIHKAFLNSKQGDREVDEFYSATWLQSEDEILEHLEGTPVDYEQCCKDSMAIFDRVQDFTLRKPQEVPEAPVPFRPKRHVECSKYPTLSKLYESDSVQERFWVNECIDQLKERRLYNDQYVSRLEEEADVMDYIGQKLDTCIFAYSLFMRHYIDLIWNCGSTVGVGRGCFVPGSKILMDDGKTKSIEDVKKGEFVYSKDGNRREVLDVLSYPCNETVFEITPSTSTHQPITCTDNHEFWVIESKPCPYDREVCNPTNCKRRCSHRVEIVKKWKRADELTESDFLFYPRVKYGEKTKERIDLWEYATKDRYNLTDDDKIVCQNGVAKPFNRYILVDKDFMYLLGVAIGDGWTKHDCSHFGIAFNSSTEKDLTSLKKCEEILSKYGFTWSETKHKQKNLIQLKVYNACFSRFMRSCIGSCSEEKHIPSFALYNNYEEMTALLGGLIASDGSYDKKQLRFSYDSINYNLVSQVKNLLSYLGVYSSISTRPAHGNDKTSYKLRAGGQFLNKLINVLPGLKNREPVVSKKQGIIVQEEGFYFRVKDVKSVDFKGTVYDLTVDKDHSYIVNQVGVHNSAGGGLSHWLLGITGTDPIVSGSYFWR